MAAKEFPLSVVIRAVDRITAPMRAIQGKVSRFGQTIGAGMRNLSDRLGIPAAVESTRRLGTALGDLGGRISRITALATGLGLALAGLGFMGVKSLVDTAATFEKFGVVLETIEGSQAAAKKSLDWVSEFAAKTPYELDEVMESFVKLRAYGIDPTNGTLRVLGDTAAAMGKPVMQAVEAIADAMTGENERLKEFGIRASKSGDKITYEYTKDGQTMRKSAQLSNRAMVQATLMAIWNDRYAGAMDKLSGTWGGMMSNLSDQWQRFKLFIMQSGPFEVLRTRLSGFLERMDAMANSGQLQQIAEAIGVRLTTAFEAIWDAGKRLVDEWPKIVAAFEPLSAVVMTVVDNFGLAPTVIGAVATVMVATLVPAIYGVVTAVHALTVALIANPIGLIVAGVVAAVAALAAFAFKIEDGRVTLTEFGHAIVAGFQWTPLMIGIRAFSQLRTVITEGWASLKLGYAIFENLRDGIASGEIKLTAFGEAVVGVGKFLGAVFRGIGDVLSWVWDVAKSAFGFMYDSIKKILDVAGRLGDKLRNAMPRWAARLFQGGLSTIVAPESMGAAQAGIRAAAAQQSTVRVQVDMNNLPPGSRVTTEQSGRPNFELNQGFAFGGM